MTDDEPTIGRSSPLFSRMAASSNVHPQQQHQQAPRQRWPSGGSGRSGGSNSSSGSAGGGGGLLEKVSHHFASSGILIRQQQSMSLVHPGETHTPQLTKSVECVWVLSFTRPPPRCHRKNSKERIEEISTYVQYSTKDVCVYAHALFIVRRIGMWPLTAGCPF